MQSYNFFLNYTNLFYLFSNFVGIFVGSTVRRYAQMMSLSEVMRLRRVVSRCEVVCWRQVVSATPKLLLHSSHHPRYACFTSPIGRHHFITKAKRPIYCTFCPSTVYKESPTRIYTRPSRRYLLIFTFLPLISTSPVTVLSLLRSMACMPFGSGSSSVK